MALNRGRYILPFTVTNPTTAPFLQLATPTNAGLEVVEFVVGLEAGTSPTSTQFVVTAQRRTSASTLPTAATIVKLDPGDVATRLASSTTTNAYGIASATGTGGDALQRWPLNIVGQGLLWVPTPKSVIEMDISQFLTWQFLATPTAGVYGGYVALEES